MPLAVRLMGSVRLLQDGQPVDVGGPKQQAVLAVLALSAGRGVTTDRIVDVVWDENPPASARRTVQSYVASLRSALGGGPGLEPSRNGYTLNVDRAEVDLLAFEDQATELLAEVGRDPDDIADRLAEVLSRWETPLDGLRGASRLRDLTAPFEELRFQAVDGLAAAQIAGTRAGDAVKLLEALVRENPTRENLWLELARGLNQLGRRDAALNAIQRAREALREHLGVNPSALLSALETDLLTDDVVRSVPPSDRSAVQSRARGNLPTPLSSFVGRTEEIRAIAALLASERLVSLVSFGGAGKTRLAIEVARHLTDRFDGDVWFVDLVSIGEPAPLPDTFAADVGLSAALDGDPIDHVVAQLADRTALIVVDNCEHLLDAVADLVSRLVRVAPDVRVLVTSRLPLGVPGELLWRVQPLDVVSTACELFVDRARLVRPGFVVEDSNRAVIEQVCERLEGIPLAIELATARLKSMTVQQIAENLDDRFSLLTTSDRGVDERQRSLYATMMWSYDLLDESDQALVRALSVFSDGCAFDAAEAINRVHDGDGTSSNVDVLDRVGRLVDASLIMFDDTADSARYRMLETVREFGADQLGHDEQGRLRHAHARHYSIVARRIDELLPVDHERSLRLGNREVANLRSAIGWSFANGQRRLGMSIATRLFGYFWWRTQHRENVRWGRTALELIEDDDDDVMLCAANTVVDALNISDRATQAFAEKRLRRGMSTIVDPNVKSRSLSALSFTLLDFDPRGAELLLEDAWLAAPIHPRSISVLSSQIENSWLTGTLAHGDTALRRLDEVLRRYPGAPSMVVKIRAGVAACAERWEEVVRLTEGYANFAEATQGDVRLLRCEALGALGSPEDAVALIPPPDADNYVNFIRHVHLVLAPIDLARGDLAEALHRLALLGDIIDRDDRRLAIAMPVAALLAVAAHSLGQNETAAVLFGFSAGERARLDIVLRPSMRPLVERAHQTSRVAIGDERFDELTGVGAALQWTDLPVVTAEPSMRPE